MRIRQDKGSTKKRQLEKKNGRSEVQKICGKEKGGREGEKRREN